MDKELVKQLLERFYNCETTAEEECRLRDYLLNENDDSEFDSDRKFFRAMAQSELQCAISDEFNSRLDSLIDWLEQKEEKGRWRRRMYVYVASLSAAAVLCAVIILSRGNGDDVKLYVNQQVESAETPVMTAEPALAIQEKVVDEEAVAEPKPAVKRNYNKRKPLTEERAKEILNSAEMRLAKAESVKLAEEKAEKQVQKALERLRNAEMKMNEAEEKIAKANQYI